mmetsp:Transcript_119093/g.344469  ORF Transcript_119093/g.344469 Transcript_119093/m.344469 type:complete len:210 (-) Transcript_119093:560-1189(-)
MSLQVGQHNRDIVDDAASFLAYPTVPRFFCQSLGRGHRLVLLECGNDVDGLLRLDKLPNAVAAQEKAVVFRADLVLGHLRHASNPTIGMAHEVADAPGHVQPGVARVLSVYSVVGVAVEHNPPSGLLDPGSLVLQIGLVVPGQRDAVVDAGLAPLPEHASAVSDMRHRKQLLHMIVDADRGGGPGHLRAEFFHAVGGVHQALGLLEHIL